MKFLSNTNDPRLPNARMYQCHSYEAFLDQKLADIEWEQYLKWINQNIIGRPKGTDTYTVEQLEEMGMVGIYAKEEIMENEKRG